MARHPFLKSIRPVNLLSFGPNTEEIELRPLNILIGPNGSGKSNLIEIIRLLWMVPEKEPWAGVLETGGADQWRWQGRASESNITAKVVLESLSEGEAPNERQIHEYSIGIATLSSSFYVVRESMRRVVDADWPGDLFTSFARHKALGELHHRGGLGNGSPSQFVLSGGKSVLSQLTSKSVQDAQVGVHMHELFEIGDFFQSFDFHQDWEFGADLKPRDPIAVGQPVERLEESGHNLAQMLAYFRDYHRPVFQRISELMKKFYEPFVSLEIRLIGTHLQIAVAETGDFSVVANRLSDGTLRWLALLTVLLNPTPAPVTCIEEPELGLHPDAIHTLADLLIDASTRTQLIVTTHSDTLLDAFTDTPEVVCVCEKVEGSTVIRRLDKERLKIWLKDYSLGHLWMSGELGGNRW